jgi:hypothetical protein
MHMPKNTRKAYGLGLAGPLPDLAPMPQLAHRNPTTADNDYELQTVWINTLTDTAFMYTGPGIWILLGMGIFTGILTITGDVGGAVPPDGVNNINIVGGSGITVVDTPGTNTLTINSTASGMSWATISSSQTLATNMGYFCIGGGNLTLLLPPVSIIGDEITVYLRGATSWKLAQGPGQTVRLGDQETNLGGSGYLQSTEQGDSITLICEIGNSHWNCVASMGNITIV